MPLTRTQRHFNSTPAEAAFDVQLRRIFRKKWFNKDAEIGYLGWCDGWATRRRQDDCENSIEAARKTGLRRRLPVLDEIKRAKDGTKKALKNVVAEVPGEVERT